MPIIAANRYFSAFPSDPEAVVIRSPRLILRPLLLQDAPRISALANDWDLIKQTVSQPFPFTRGDAENMILDAWQPDDEEEEEEILLGIQRTSDTALIGAMAINRDGMQAEVGYWIGRQYWSQGYATEALAALLHQVRFQWGITVLEAVAFHENFASAAVLRKCGFKHKSDQRSHLPDRGGERMLNRFLWEAG